MLNGKRILIAEDNFLIADALADGVQDRGGIPLGPVPTNREALRLIDRCPDGAILDGNLLDGPIIPVAQALSVRKIPMIFHTGAELPESLRTLLPDIPVLQKPLPYETVIRALAVRLRVRP